MAVPLIRAARRRSYND
jgi:PleD family two-component response regulator